MGNRLLLVGVSKDANGDYFIRLGSDNVHYFDGVVSSASKLEKFAKQLQRTAMHDIEQVYAIMSNDHKSIEVNELKEKGNRIL